jgi:hypothetical protein
MSTFSVKVRTEHGEYKFDQVGSSSSQVHASASERFGNLCAVMVKAK